MNSRLELAVIDAWNVPSEITRYSREPISVSAHRNQLFNRKSLRWRLKVNILVADSRLLRERRVCFEMSR
jgi:hypothetical protein